MPTLPPLRALPLEFFAWDAVSTPDRATRMVGAGLSLAAILALFTWIGWSLDRWLDSGPWFLIGGTMFGGISGILYLVRTFAPELLPRRSPPRDGDQTTPRN